jgi:proteasome lid subunit RPN8/RPN11
MLNIRRSDLQKIVKHCESQYPNEACGLLSGSDNRVDTVYSLLNENPSPTFYRIDSKDHFRVIREMREAGKELIGIYHSHTGSPAYPSPTDVNLAYYPEAVYVIVSLMDRKNPDVKGYLICEDAITEVPINIL